jgi:hypothetical protein
LEKLCELNKGEDLEEFVIDVKSDGHEKVELDLKTFIKIAMENKQKLKDIALEIDKKEHIAMAQYPKPFAMCSFLSISKAISFSFCLFSIAIFINVFKSNSTFSWPSDLTSITNSSKSSPLFSSQSFSKNFRGFVDSK